MSLLLLNALQNFIEELEDGIRYLLGGPGFASLHHLTSRPHQLMVELAHDLCEANSQLWLPLEEVVGRELLEKRSPRWWHR